MRNMLGYQCAHIFTAITQILLFITIATLPFQENMPPLYGCSFSFLMFAVTG